MTQRDFFLVLGGGVATVVVSVVLFLAIVASQQPAGASTVVVGRRPVATAVPIAQIERRLPTELRFLAPLVAVQRGVAQASREAAGVFLVVLLTGAALVFGRDQVMRIQASSAGDAAEQARVLGIGVGALIALASGVILGFFVVLRSLVQSAPAGNLAFGLQTIVALLALVLLIVGVAALLGFTAASWRLGVWVLRLQPSAALRERVPAALAAVVVAAILYLLAQLPYVGPIVAAVLLAYSLGAFVRARLVRTEARPA